MSVTTELTPAARANAGDDDVAPDMLVGAPAPEPAPASFLAPLAEYNLSQGITPAWVRAWGWPEMADAMAAIETLEAPQVGLSSLRQSM